MLLPQRHFRALDGARLDERVLLRAEPGLRAALHRLASEHAAYSGGGRVPLLSRACQEVVDLLGRAFRLPAKRVVLRDSPRPHRRRRGRVVFELHGQCDPAGGPIEVYARTAVHARPVALKTLLETLLHEWVHHHDFCRFGASVHSGGFYARLAQVYRPARDWLARA